MPPVQELDEQSPKESPKTSPKQSPKTEVDESVKESPEASPKPSIQEPTESPQEDSPSEPPEEAPKKSAEQSLRESPSIKSSDVDVAMETGLLRAAASGDGASFGKVANDDIELIAGAIEEICAVLADAPNLIVRISVSVEVDTAGIRVFFFCAGGHLDFESADTAQNDEFKSSFHSSYSRLLNVKTSPRNSIRSLDTFRYVR